MFYSKYSAYAQEAHEQIDGSIKRSFSYLVSEEHWTEISV